MKTWTLALILVAGCGGGEPSAPQPAKPSLPAQTTAAQPTPPPPLETAPPPKAPESPREPAPPPAAAPAPAYIPVASKAGRSVEGQIHLPAFKLRSVSGLKAPVFIDGEAYSILPTLWTVTSEMEFDPKIPVDSWPPEGARYAGKTTNLDESAMGSAEVYIARGKALEARYPHLQKGEHVVYVRAHFLKGTRQGAVRLWAGTEAPLRYTGYSPFTAAESEEESRLLRTLWFDDPLDE